MVPGIKPKAPHPKRVHQFFAPLPFAPTPIPQRFPHEGAEGKKRKSISPKMFCRKKEFQGSLNIQLRTRETYSAALFSDSRRDLGDLVGDIMKGKRINVSFRA